LSKTLTEEKSSLPDSQDIQQEKTHQKLLESVETFPVDTLKHVAEIKVCLKSINFSGLQGHP
jgi:hypothetical protein